MVEVWKRAPGEPSPYDGLWKLETRQIDNPELTDFTETKMIGGGHFIILQSALFKGEKIRNFGFGIFDVKEGGKVLESGMTGSWDNYSEHKAEVVFQLIGDNRMAQSFTSKGREVTQIYFRM